MAGIIEVKDQGKLRIYDADNSNYVDIVVPSSVTANRTITIPDASFTVPTAEFTSSTITGQSAETSIADDDLVVISDTSASGALKKMTKANFVSGAGISEADAYRLAADVSGDSEPIATSNMERVDDATFSKIGTGVSYNTSNGRFTFGATGLYYVEVTAVFLIDASSDNNVNFILQGSADDFTNSDDLCQCNFGGDGNIERNTNTNSSLFNCTNTSTHKVRLNYNGTSG
ncbi:hypothetical protein N8707_01240, partial [Candidatus Pelagibacter sp.]|nr:hypothetical protein [Candidatus Pelagibacter sp.]